MDVDLAIRSRRVLTADGPRAATVHVRGGRIAAIDDARPAGLLDAGDAVVMAGLVDTHVHVNEPGRADWEGFGTATRAAAAGGVTAIVDMPLNSDPATTTPAALEAKRAAARGKCRVDYGFWGGLVPGNARDVGALVRAGVRGVKAFLAPSGIDEFPSVAEADLRLAMPAIARAGSVLLVHAEWDPSPSPASAAYGDYLASRPPRVEDAAVERMIALARETRCRVHIVHLSSAGALAPLAAASRGGVAIAAETCPHYLTLEAERVPDGATEYKCAPPIRGRDNRERLWAGLADGTVGMIVSDHSPCPADLKRGDFGSAWGGISSLQLGLSIVWTEASRRGIAPGRIAEWMSRAPARLAGWEGRKGALAVGYDADLVVWDPDREFRVEPARLQHRHPVTPYAGRTLRGVVERTFVRGRIVYDRGEFPGEPAGREVP